jgi:hypothetical protein
MGHPCSEKPIAAPYSASDGSAKCCYARRRADVLELAPETIWRSVRDLAGGGPSRAVRRLASL